MRTPSQTVGPFYSIGLCRTLGNELVPEGVELAGTLIDGRGDPIPDGMIEIWDAAGRRWGRCGTQPSGDFSFRVPADADHLEVYVFARGLLRHQWTRVYLRDDANDDLLLSLSAAERKTLVARHETGGMRFDIRMQGDNATAFFAH
ncbi:MAG: protocatechuate 3,4-dioxygenase subunit alpha [Gaiellaceae bacterium]